jgi:TolB-like protein/Tfp pilus assembly protein PilF
MPNFRDRLSGLFAELRRRRVGRVAVAYAVSAWLLIEVADTIFPRLLLPDWSVTAVIIAVAIGFPVALLLAWSFDIVPDQAGGMRTLRPKQWLALALGSVLFVVAAGAVTRMWVRSADASESLVVLPIEALATDSSQNYFAAGMHEALIGELAQINALRVISRTSALHYRGKSVPEIARELNVRNVVEASLARTGDEVEIRVQLIRALPEERSVWSDVYRRDVRAVRTLHGEIARTIAQQIRVRLSADEQTRLTTVTDVDPRTYEAYLRGMYHLQKNTPEDIAFGLRYMHDAVARNPADARAYAGLALGYATLGHGVAPPEDAWARARAAALRAVALDPNLAEGHAALADVKYYYEWDWEGAEQAFRRANELNPNLAMNHYHYAWYLATLDRLDEAIVEHKLARDLDPLTAIHTGWLGGLYIMAGRPDEAIREAKAAIELQPDAPVGYLVLGDAYLEKGMFEEAIATHREASVKLPRARWFLAHTLAVAGRTDEARQIAATLEAEKPNAWNSFGLGAIYSALGDQDRAFQWLAAEPHHAWLPSVRNIYWFKGLRGDPRLAQLVERMHLPPARDYVRSTDPL